MITVKGLYNSAVCFTPALEQRAAEQIKAVCDRREFADCKIRIMPDVHAGKGCTIGTTMTVGDRIVPGMVGVDIGCGMETVMISDTSVDLDRLDSVIRSQIPCGKEVRDDAHALNAQIDLTELRCAREVNTDRAMRSIGTLGGGNHFIELDRDENGGLYLVVHSGSRHIGCEVAEYYQNEGYRALCGNTKSQIHDMILALRAQGRFDEIQNSIAETKKKRTPETDIPKDLAYVEGALFDDYIHDMKIVQHFAFLNRLAMTKIIVENMGWTETDRFTTVHNYIDTDAMILRKGSVSAKAGQRLLIPINMRDGSLICTGKGNDEWNCSAPHGAGRLMSRKDAFERLSMDEYRTEMSDIYSTCVVPDTIDESPMAYKSMDEIIGQIEPTADIVRRITPVYNFKATE